MADIYKNIQEYNPNKKRKILIVFNDMIADMLSNHAKQSATNVLKTSSKRVIQKTAKATGDLIGNNIANKIKGVSKNPETIANEHDKKIPKERYTSPEKRQDIIDNLRSIIIV